VPCSIGGRGEGYAGVDFRFCRPAVWLAETNLQSWTIWPSGHVCTWTRVLPRRSCTTTSANGCALSPNGNLRPAFSVNSAKFRSRHPMCVRATRLQMPILIRDVTVDEDWIPFLSFSESAGFGGVLSIPLLSRAGNLIGVTSCHFAGCAKPTKSEMKFRQGKLRVRKRCHRRDPPHSRAIAPKRAGHRWRTTRIGRESDIL
jgi:hypothetical protein